MMSPNRCLLALILLALAACTSAPTGPSVDTAALEARAAQEIADGNPRTAAELYRQLAAAVSGSSRAAYLIESAKLDIEIRDEQSAGLRLDEAAQSANRSQSQMIDALLAELDLLGGRPSDALLRVKSLGADLDADTLLVALKVRGEAQFALGDTVDAVAALAEREVWLDDPAEILANQQDIWDGLQSSTVAISSIPTGDPTVDGWLALRPVALTGDVEQQRRRLLEWRVDHAQHPAARVLLMNLLAAQDSTGRAHRIALLLPLHSTAREPALAIQDGFMAAHFAAGELAQTSIRIYDTGASGAADAYLRAQLDGADFIVGPLRREEVDAVITQAGYVPTLALNFSQAQVEVPDRFYQFALDPDDEARAIAQRAYANGARRAVAMMQSDSFGSRMVTSFRDEFEALGGELVSTMPYEAALQDFSSRISSLMNLDRSYQRQRRLAANLGVDITFEPRRRQDIDMIFLSADADTGRLLAPQLEYYYAGDIPTYAISEIYEPGRAGGDGDLDGIIFPDVPWLVAPDPDTVTMSGEIRAFWPRRSSEFARFYGMGVDAYNLVARLRDGGFFTTVSGVSGRLYMDLQNRIHRDLPFAQFRNGTPEAMAPVETTAGLLGARRE